MWVLHIYMFQSLSAQPPMLNALWAALAYSSALLGVVVLLTCAEGVGCCGQRDLRGNGGGNIAPDPVCWKEERLV